MSKRLKYVSLPTRRDEIELYNVSPISEDSKNLPKSDIESDDIQSNSEENANLSATDSRSNQCKLLLKNLEGKLLIFTGGSITVVVISLVKHISHMPVGEFAFCLSGFSVITMLPVLFFQERSIDTKGKLKYVVLRAFCGALAGILKIWSARVMDYGDSIAILALCPIFASIFSRILWKEKINIFTIISLILGLGGMVLIAKPSFIFGTDGSDKKMYNPFFPIVPMSAAILFGFAFSCMRKIGTDINMLVVPLYITAIAMIMAIVFDCAKGDVPILPGCYSDRLFICLGGVGLFVGLALTNKGLTIEKSGPGTLIRNLDIVTAYIIQVLFFNNPPQMLSIIGAILILTSVVLVTINKLFREKFNKYEI